MHVLVVTSYPQKGRTHGAGTVGIASYAKNTLVAMQNASRKEKKDLRITVLAETLREGQSFPEKGLSFSEDAYTEDGIDVRRIWKRKSPGAYVSLLKAILSYPHESTVLLEFELSMFGSVASLLLFPLFLLILRFRSIPVILVPHQVVDDINALAGHIGMKENSLQARLFNMGIQWFYRVSLPNVSKIVVFEEYLKRKLTKFVSEKKIVVIPHGVEVAGASLRLGPELLKERVSDPVHTFRGAHQRSVLTLNYFGPGQRPAPAWGSETRSGMRKRLGIRHDDFVLLYFGFIAWYKGADAIASAVSSMPAQAGKQLAVSGKKVKLIIAGGENPNHTDNKFYMEYVEKIKKIAALSNGSIVVTGFVPEDDIAAYFLVADLVVLPYRTFMSSSGPLSLAFTYGKPVILSEALQPYVLTKDFAEAMQEAEVTEEDLFGRSRSPTGSATVRDEIIPPVEQNLLQRTSDQLRRLEKFSRLMAEKRSFDRIGEMYLNEVRNSLY